MEFSRQEHWSELLFPSPGRLLDSGIQPTSLASPALAGGSLPLVPTWKDPLSAQLSTNKETRRELSGGGVRIKFLEVFLESKFILPMCGLEGVVTKTPLQGGREVRTGQPAHLVPIR